MTPTIRWYQRWSNDDQWLLDSRFRLIYSMEDYHDYLYQVAPEYAIAERTEYDAERGFSGSRLMF